MLSKYCLVGARTTLCWWANPERQDRRGPRGLALRIAEGNVPEEFKDAPVYSLDMGALLAGAKYRGDFEARMKGVVGELKRKPGAVLVIDEIHTIVGAGATSGGSMDASNLLKPVLAAGELRCIGTTTHEEFRNHFEKDRALTRRFQRVDIREPSASDCLNILRGLQALTRAFIKCAIPRGPSGGRRAFGPLRAGSPAARQGHRRSGRGRGRRAVAAGLPPGSSVTGQDVERVVAAWPGIPAVP